MTLFLNSNIPKITIVTVVLNAVDLIERTLQSVASQDYPNFEYIVIDGMSTDGTLEILDKYRSKINLLLSGKDGGIYEAMNKGSAVSSGEWILFMNAGDFFVSNDVIRKVFAVADSNKCDVIYGDSIFVHQDYRWIERASTQLTLSDGLGFCHQSCFIRTSLQKDFGFDVNERIAADYDLGLRLFKSGKIFQYVDVVIAEFLTGGFSALDPKETIRLRHRVYSKYYKRSKIIMHLKILKLVAKEKLKLIIPTRFWNILKRIAHQDRVVS